MKKYFTENRLLDFKVSEMPKSVQTAMANNPEAQAALEEAVNAKKIHHQWVPDILYVEKNSINQFDRNKSNLNEKI